MELSLTSLSHSVPVGFDPSSQPSESNRVASSDKEFKPKGLLAELLDSPASKNPTDLREAQPLTEIGVSKEVPSKAERSSSNQKSPRKFIPTQYIKAFNNQSRRYLLVQQLKSLNHQLKTSLKRACLILSYFLDYICQIDAAIQNDQNSISDDQCLVQYDLINTESLVDDLKCIRDKFFNLSSNYSEGIDNKEVSEILQLIKKILKPSLSAIDTLITNTDMQNQKIKLQTHLALVVDACEKIESLTEGKS